MTWSNDKDSPGMNPTGPSTSEGHWEHYEHMADIGVCGVSQTLAGAFEQAALAMTAVITDPAGVHDREKIVIDCEAPDIELLLVDWLNALVYEMSTRKMLFSRFQVCIEQNHLHALAWGEKVNPQVHEPAVEIKGATYTTLRVSQRSDGNWQAQCVVDV